MEKKGGLKRAKKRGAFQKVNPGSSVEGTGGAYPLTIAADRNRPAVIERLLEDDRVEPNATTDEGATAL